MFKGFTKKFQEALEKNNRGRDEFIFSFMDLELVEVVSEKRKLRILSEEVSQKLHELVSGGPKPTFIELNAHSDDRCKTIFQKISEINCIKYWLKINKRESPGWKKYRKGLEDIKVSQDGTLSIGYFEVIRGTYDPKEFYGSVYDSEYSWEYNRYKGLIHHGYDEKIQETFQTRTSAIQAIENAIKENKITSLFIPRSAECLHCSDELGVNYRTHIGKCLWRPDRINEFKDRQIEVFQTRSSSLQEIQNTIQNGNIDSTTLGDAMFFLGESYVDARPMDCLYCNTHEELVPERALKYYECHINKCLWRSDRINDFKDSQVELISRIINKFNDYKKEEIQKVIDYAKEQGLTETELDNTRPGWQDYLLKLTNRDQIEDYQYDQLYVDIENLVAAKNKPEEEKPQAEEKVKERAQKSQEKLQNEQETKKAQAQKEEAERIQREQEQAQKEEEKLKKEFEETKKKEENFWFWEHLEEAAKQKEQEEDQNENSNSQILNKFQSIPNFDSQEKITDLINPVKNDPNFLQSLQEHNIQSLTALIIDKSPKEIIITVKRFEYDQEKEKEKAIRAYYHLSSNDLLTDEQINDYLYKEATGQIIASESPSPENKLPIPLLILGGGLLTLLGVIIIIYKLSRRRIGR
jgi:hypothetical protein